MGAGGSSGSLRAWGGTRRGGCHLGAVLGNGCGEPWDRATGDGAVGRPPRRTWACGWVSGPRSRIPPCPGCWGTHPAWAPPRHPLPWGSSCERWGVDGRAVEGGTHSTHNRARSTQLAEGMGVQPGHAEGVWAGGIVVPASPVPCHPPSCTQDMGVSTQGLYPPSAPTWSAPTSSAPRP